MGSVDARAVIDSQDNQGCGALRESLQLALRRTSDPKFAGIIVAGHLEAKRARS